MNNQSEQMYEENRLEETIAAANEQLRQARKAAEEKKAGITEAKKAVFEDSSHGFTNLYSSDDFEALVELNQLHDPVTESIADYEEEIRNIRRLENIIEHPYFARIDFQFEEEESPEEIYIGRSSLSKKTSREILVYDWRSPIASVFYRFMTGPACYDAAGGRIDGTVTLKRQYEIKNQKLQYYFDTDRNISDEFLRQLLSKNTSPKMKAVVETIQKEQDTVIRDMGSDLLMVQGIAGSGKTSIALHRAAYLMYQGLQQAKLSSDNILIISPNNTFEQYISDVLPELGEEDIHSIVFDDLLKTLLQGKKLQPKNEFLEQAVTNNSYKELVKASMEFKTSKVFQEILDRFVLEIPMVWMKFGDISYHGQQVITGEELQAWILRRPDVPLGVRLEQVEDYVLERIFGTAKKREDREGRRQVKEQIQKFCRIDVVDLYGKLFLEESFLEDWKNNWLRNDKARQMAENIAEYTRENLQSGRVYYDDAIAAAYLYLKLYGTGEYRNIRQVVIDEAQDYYPLQYVIFRMLFPNGKFTVLGDICQTLGKSETLSLYEQIQEILEKKKSTLVTLNKSFRCTNEILKFSQQFLKQELNVESFNRSGDQPKIVSAASHEELLQEIVQEVSICREKGLETICLICKTQKNAARLYEDLKSRIAVQLRTDQDTESIKGTFLMPVCLAKGLEFDAVIVCDGDAENYYSPDDKNLLYVECTRALHRLSLMFEGEGSCFIEGEPGSSRSCLC